MSKIQIAACVVSAGIAALHTFVGTGEVAVPMLQASDLVERVKYLNFYCWHIVTLLLWAMAAGFGWSALIRNSNELVFF